ncbi:MAG: hypothetical protein IKH77_09930 [Clostridia bacterium]|nr:hypothetical protein [Clostridia bacterium]
MNRTPEEILAGMSTVQKAAQVVMPAFTRWTDPEGDSGPDAAPVPEDVRSILGRYGFAGVILFAPDVTDTARAVRLIHAMQAAGADGGHPLLLTMIDQEGGETTRLGQGTRMPGNMALGAADSLSLTEAAGRVTGEELRVMGLNCDAAPVLDVNSNPANPIIGVRSFSDDPSLTAAHGVRFMQGLQAAGVIPVVKHFPGHGDTDTDSHVGLPLVDKPLETLRGFELVPFRACIEAGAEMLMTAHIQYPQVERQTHVSRSTEKRVFLPATLSRRILTDLLRGELGYRGVVISDAMNMQAVARHFTPMEIARLALCAGVDILLMPVDTTAAAGAAALTPYLEGIARMAERGEIPMAVLDAAVLRVLRLKARHGLLASRPGAVDPARAAKTVGSPSHRALAWSAASRSLTLVKNDDTLPLQLSGNESMLVLVPDKATQQSAACGIQKAVVEGWLQDGAGLRLLILPELSDQALEEAVRGAKYVVAVSAVFSMASLDPRRPEGAISARMDRAISLTRECGGRFILISGQLPYDVARYPRADAALLAWCAREAPGTAGGTGACVPNIAAAVHGLLSGAAFTGKLPLRIPAMDAQGQIMEKTLYPRGFSLPPK